MLRWMIIVLLGVGLALAAILRKQRPASAASASRSRWPALDGPVFWIVALTGLGLALTGFYGPLLVGKPVGGYALLAHVGMGGAFLTLLPLLGLLQGARHAESPEMPVAVKSSFWVFLLTGLVTAVTILLSMIPLFDAHGLHLMLTIHSFAGGLLTIALFVLILNR
jgi:hypothetical protein